MNKYLNKLSVLKLRFVIMFRAKMQKMSSDFVSDSLLSQGIKRFVSKKLEAILAWIFSFKEIEIRISLTSLKKSFVYYNHICINHITYKNSITYNTNIH